MFRFTPRQIEVFLAVCRGKSFRQASEDLGISQAAVSEQIRLLEQQIGIILFRREPGRTVTLTPDGARFREAALVFASHGQELGRMFQSSLSISIRAFIGAFILNEYVRPALTEFLKNNGDIALEFISDIAEEDINESINRGKIDCAMLVRPAAQPRGEFRSMLSEPAFIYATKELRQVARQEGLAAVPFILWSIPRLHRADQIRAIAAAGVPRPKINYEVQLHDVAAQLAISGVGAVVMPQSTARRVLNDENLVPLIQVGMWERRLYISDRIHPNVADRLFRFFQQSAGSE